MSIITARSLSKRYRLGSLNAATLRDEIQSWWERWRRGDNADAAPACDREDDFWALRDVSFDIQEGDVVGIIGGNGAGKSTLLKVLSRITEPTSGEARIRGRVASLLEVGTGFHPELSGRENIFLNGTILGMSKGEVKAKFDEIVDFSGIEKFIDTPVKRYSSGMYVRLAFAVAAHLDPEIMIVDEVLAVGDGEFQKKCLGKMKSIHESGRTVLFVSHQLNMLTSLCTRGIVLKQGSVTFDGAVDEAVLHYQSASGRIGVAMLDVDAAGGRIGNDTARLHRAWVSTIDGEPCSSFSLDDSIAINIEYTIITPAGRTMIPNISICDEYGATIFFTLAPATDQSSDINQPGRWTARCILPGNLMNTGTFNVGLAMTVLNPAEEIAFHEPHALAFHVSETFGAEAERRRSGWMGVWPGPLRPRCQWTVTMAPHRAET
jgi:lipopolysaccharide transport system ATP-binding protein